MAKTTRNALLYIPEWKGPIEGYVVNCYTKKGWRTAALMERNDFMQEAYLVFLRLNHKYPRLDTPQHFMALFKTSWHRHYTDLSYADSSLRTMPLQSQLTRDDEDANTLEAVGDLENSGILATMIRQAPSEIKQVLALFLHAPSELLDAASSSWKNSGHNSDCGNKMLCQALGRPEGTDVIGAVHEYFTGSSV